MASIGYVQVQFVDDAELDSNDRVNNPNVLTITDTAMYRGNGNKKDGYDTITAAGGGGGAGHKNTTFDASRSSAVYGKSDTVQPHSITCFIWRRTA